MVVRQRVLDLVGHGQLGVAQHARLPQLGDAGSHQLGVVVERALRPEIGALGQQLGDGALRVEDALALHLGRVGRQHRRDERAVQRGGDVGGAVIGVVQALEGHRQRAVLQVALALVVRAPAHVLPILGDVGQVREVAERADHAHRLVGRQVLQQPVEHPPGARILVDAVGHRQLAHALDQLEGRQSFLFPDDLAQQPPEQPDVLDQRPILVGCRGRRLGRCTLPGRLGGRAGGGGAGHREGPFHVTELPIAKCSRRPRRREEAMATHAACARLRQQARTEPPLGRQASAGSSRANARACGGRARRPQRGIRSTPALSQGFIGAARAATPLAGDDGVAG